MALDDGRPAAFQHEGWRICLKFKPTLPRWLFAADDTMTFTFLGGCTVTCRRRDTFREDQMTAEPWGFRWGTVSVGRAT